MTTLKHGLNLQKKGPSGASKPAPAKRKPIFGEDDSDQEDASNSTKDNVQEIGTFDEDVATSRPRPASSSKPPSEPPKSKLSQPPQQSNLSSLRTQLQHTREAESLDSNIYDYDAAYDAIHAKSKAKAAAERTDAAERKPKYMNNLLEAAEVRKKDHLRAQDRLLQRERETEGEDFADKDKFVTGAYKEQQEELRRAQEEEAKREEEEAAKKRRGMGMTSFYRSVMDEEDKKHREAVAAASQAKPEESQPQEADEEETLSAEQREAALARELNAKGAHIVINDEGEVADKRQLLSAGLNVAPKPKGVNATPSQSRPETQRPDAAQNWRGRTEAQKAMRERQTRMMEEQLEQARKRAAEEEAEERAKRERAAKSQKTGADVSSARERYLQRKQQQAAAAAADANKE